MPDDPVTIVAHDVLTLQEAADLLRVDTMTVLAMIEEGTLPAVQIGKGKERRHYRIARSAIEQLLKGTLPPAPKGAA